MKSSCCALFGQHCGRCSNLRRGTPVIALLSLPVHAYVSIFAMPLTCFIVPLIVVIHLQSSVHTVVGSTTARRHLDDLFIFGAMLEPLPMRSGPQLSQKSLLACAATHEPGCLGRVACVRSFKCTARM